MYESVRTISDGNVPKYHDGSCPAKDGAIAMGNSSLPLEWLPIHVLTLTSQSINRLTGSTTDCLVF